MTDWWRGATIYQIYPRSFQDDSGDGLGDLPGIIRRLDHVASLGVDAIWLSPIFPSPMKDMGYDVSDYCGIDPSFGTLEDFDQLVAKAHALGIRVIIDQVLSHTSDRHPWFLESRMSKDNAKADWYVWADPLPDGSPPNNWLAVFGGGAWEWEARRRQYYLHNFLVEQPDLNFHNPEVQDAVLEVMRFWLERGVDGFRLDTVNFYTHDAELRSNPPVTEARPNVPPVNPFDMQRAVHSRNRPENLSFVERMRALTDSFDARMMVGEVGEKGDLGIGLHGGIHEGATGGSTWPIPSTFFSRSSRPRTSGTRWRRSSAPRRKAGPAGAFPTTTCSATSAAGRGPGEEEAVAKLSIAILASLPGSICLYQGEELGQTETELTYEELTDPPGLRFWPENKGRDGCRTPMVWEARDAARGLLGGEAVAPREARAGRACRRQAGGRCGVRARRLSSDARLPSGAGGAEDGRGGVPRPGRACAGPSCGGRTRGRPCASSTSAARP
jgi:alpha-glucosidase